MTVTRPLLAEDLQLVAEVFAAHGSSLRNEQVFLTGGTGFVGTWLVETLLHANRTLGLNCRVLMISRDPVTWAARLPHLASAPEVRVVAGDVRSFGISAEHCKFAIHAAYDSGKLSGTVSPLETIDTIVAGTQRVLSACREMRTERLLFVSSGAVYGPQPHDVPQLAETCRLGPDPLLPGSAYGESKRVAELLVAADASARRTTAVIARAFAFIGPHLPLDVHFAAGNFLRDAMAGKPLEIRGDGTPLRSYLYAAEMAAWLWTMLLRGDNGRAYNVGSGHAVSIAELAGAIGREVQPQPEVRIAQQAVPGRPSDRYVPDVRRAEEELGLRCQVDLSEAIRRTLRWWQSGPR